MTGQIKSRLRSCEIVRQSFYIHGQLFAQSKCEREIYVNQLQMSIMSNEHLSDGHRYKRSGHDFFFFFFEHYTLLK